MYSTKGMFTNLDPSLKDIDYVTLPADASTSFFLPGKPQPGQAMVPAEPCFLGQPKMDPFDCCFTSSFTAAACYFYQEEQGRRAYIPVDVSGNATFQIGQFVLPVQGLRLKEVPIMVTDEVRAFSYSVGPVSASFSCADITFVGDDTKTCDEVYGPQNKYPIACSTWTSSWECSMACKWQPNDIIVAGGCCLDN